MAAVELVTVAMPLVAPFAAAHATVGVRELLLVRVRTDGPDGWGECAALGEPTYSDEYVAGARDVLARFLVPAVVGRALTPAGAHEAMAVVQGHPMAKAALHMAVLDASLRAGGVPLQAWLGGAGTAVDAGVAVGLQPSLDALCEVVGAHLAEGYRRVKLKVAPGRDVEPVRALRDRFGGFCLQVDANGAYTIRDIDALAGLDDFGLACIEQPLAADDLAGHAWLSGHLRTPVCLDESITSAARAREAIERGACSVVCVKPGRLGGLDRAVAVHDLCRAAGVGAWVGGMLESGLARAANVALASLPGFTLPGDLSASERYWRRDLTAPFVLQDGRLAVPAGPGLGVEPLAGVLGDVTTDRTELAAP